MSSFNIIQILATLPHRYPFLLVDKIIEFEPNKRIVGIKNVTINEPYFQGHFPNNPIMPGVLLVEAMAQTGAVGLLQQEKNKGKELLLVGMDKVKFRRIVQPPAQLIIEIEFIKERLNIGKVKGSIKVDSELICEAELTYAIR